MKTSNTQPFVEAQQYGKKKPKPKVKPKRKKSK